MSRILVFDLNNNAVGELTAKCNRGWILLGNTGVSDGGQTTVTIDQDLALQPWLQLGNMVLVERPPLPAWLGIIDTPWRAKLPVELTFYNAEYLFSLRAAERTVHVVAPFADIVNAMIDLVNEQEETYLALGQTDHVQTTFDKVIEQRNIWDQVITILQETGYEMILRAERNAQNRLYLYADVGIELGIDTNFLLHDGEHANMTVIDANVNGRIINRAMGVSGESTAESQLQTRVFEDQASQSIFRTRSDVVQFRDVTQITALEGYTQVFLDSSKRPYLDLTVDVMDNGEAFNHLRVGNRLLIHAANIYLPGGIRGWRGSVRILAMVYDEQQNTVRTTLRGIL